MRKSKTDQQWNDIIDKYRSSGLTQQVFCTKESISIHTLRSRINTKNKNQQTPTPWAELKLDSLGIINPGWITIESKDITIHINHQIDNDVIKSIITCLHCL
jgi:hypothetical protein